MKIFNSFLIAAAACSVVACTQRPQQQQPEPIRLFNGTDLNGWTYYIEDSTKNPQEEFVVRDSVIALSGTFGYIRTDSAYNNYKLNVEWRWPDSATNSGIFVQIAEDGIWPSCYECQLWTGRAGDLINSGGSDCAEYRNDTTLMIVPKMVPSNEKPVTEWNAAEIICTDSTVTVSINGTEQNRITGISNKSGHIGLQSEGGPIEFRNVVLTPLN